MMLLRYTGPEKNGLDSIEKLVSKFPTFFVSLAIAPQPEANRPISLHYTMPRNMGYPASGKWGHFETKIFFENFEFFANISR